MKRFLLFVVVAATGCPSPMVTGEGEGEAAEGEGEGSEGEIIVGEGEGETALPFDVIVEESTPEQIALYAPLPTGFAADAAVRVRVLSGNTIIQAQPMLRIVPAWVAEGAPTPVVDAFASVIFDLIPDTAYDVEHTHPRAAGHHSTCNHSGEPR